MDSLAKLTNNRNAKLTRGDFAMETAAIEKKVDRRVLRTRRAIMEAFEKLLGERGLEGITVSAIAREADIDRKTFYLHYKSVNDLVSFKTEESLERIALALEEHGEDAPPIERVHIVLMEVNAILLENIDAYCQIAASLSVNQALVRFEASVLSVLAKRDVDQSLIDNQQIRMQLQFYIAGAMSLYSTWLRSDRSTPIETVSQTIEDAISASVFPTIALFQQTV